MAENLLKMRIQFRRDTTANWEQYKNIVPAAGEPCFDIELGTLKIGDGVKTYEELTPIGDVGAVSVSTDGLSIVLDNNTMKLVGFDAADVGAQPRKGEDGKLEWVIPTSIDDIKTDVENLKEIISPSTEGSIPLLDRIQSLEEKVDGEADGSIDAKIDEKINEFATQISDDGTINTFKELINYAANHGGELDTILGDVTTLQDLVGTEKVSDQITNAVRDKVDAEDGKSLVDDNLIAKLESVDENAQANKIENISIGKTVLEVSDKSVAIPVGAGLKATEEISIAEDGGLSVGKINFSKIMQDTETVIILDGGSAV